MVDPADRSDDSQSDSGWDDVVDVICVGTSPGVVAYAVCCAQADLDVLIVGAGAVGDPELETLYSAMTQDLGDPPAEPDLPVIRLGPPATAPGGPLEPFIGEHLRQWSARCAGSPLGVMFTSVPEILEPMCADGYESVAAAVIGTLPRGEELGRWLGDLAEEHGLLRGGAVRDTFFRLVIEDGRVGGVELRDRSLVRASQGLAIPVGSSAQQTHGCFVGSGGQVALVGRPAGRYARVEFVDPHAKN